MATRRDSLLGALLRAVPTARAVLASDTSALMLSNFCSALLGIVTGLVTARALGPVGRGDLAVVIFWPALLASLMDAGILESITVRIARQPDCWGRHARSGLVLAAAASVLAGATGFVAVPLLLQADQTHLVSLTRMTLAFIPGSLCSAVAVGVLLGSQRFKAVALIRTANVVLYLGALLVAVSFERATIETIAWLTIASRAFPAIAGAPMILGCMRGGGPWGLKRHLRDAAALQGARAVTVIAGAQDRLLANWTLSQAAIGQWQVVAALATVMQFVSQAVSQKLLSGVAPRRADGSAISAAFARAVLFTGACAVVAIPLLPLAIPLLYGSGFAPAIGPGTVVVIASVVGAGAMTLQAASRARDDVTACLLSESVGMVFMLVVAVPASLHFGLMGLAFGYLAGRLASLGWMLRSTVRRGDAEIAELFSFSCEKLGCARDEGWAKKRQADVSGAHERSASSDG